MTTVETGCAKSKYPDREEATELEEAQEPEEMTSECPDGYACYTDKEDAAIAQKLLHLQNTERWARITWKSCKSEETTPSPGSD